MTADSKIDRRWDRLQELFSRALDLPESERSAFIARECADDVQLHDELRDLLAADAGDASGSLLTNALGAAIDATSRDRRKALVGRQLGNYRLAAVLGHGGTGTVYLAERADRQYSAQVAIKIVDSATLHGDLGQRFRAERQILASLNHPNIARLLDAGETPEGQPYLVMEYVHGEPLDRYCDRNELNIEDRLRLFLEICNAVQYAHQNLVVHRDLKPANILVAADGAPKLLDFGIAKLLDTGDAAAVLALTRMNDRLLTPEYASPEQILGRAVTTASDVYALGVVLYELLTGLRPYTVPASASQLELERSICVTDPQRPSAAVRRSAADESTLGGSTISAITAARGAVPEKLARRLEGDIDSIVMRALRKEPERRYASVEQLAADVRRYLSREPVLARQGNWIYYSQRFVRRHTFGVSAGAAFAIFIIAFAITMSVQTQRIAMERDRAELESRLAEEVSKFMLNVFSASEPQTSKGREITARELLDSAARGIRSNLGQHPEVRARLLEAMGQAYRRQGEHERSISYLEDALRIRNGMANGGGQETATVMTELAIALRLSGDLTAADKLLQQALAISHQYKNERSRTYAKLLTNLGRVEMLMGEIGRAEQHLQQSLTLTREVLGPQHPDVAAVLLELSGIHLWHDDMKNAERTVREAVDIFRSSVDALHPDRVFAEGRLGEVLLSQNRINEAEPVFERSLDASTTLYGAESRQVADLLDSLARIRKLQGRMRDAEAFARRAVGVSEKVMGAEHSTTAYYRTSLASLLLRTGDYKGAEAEIQRALATYEKTLPPDHQYVASAEYILGEALLGGGQLDRAEAVLTASMNRWKRSDAPDWRSARSASALGEALHRQGRSREAENYLEDGYRKLASDAGADREARIKAQERIAKFYSDRGERKKLEALTATTTERAR